MIYFILISVIIIAMIAVYYLIRDLGALLQKDKDNEVVREIKTRQEQIASRTSDNADELLERMRRESDCK